MNTKFKSATDFRKSLEARLQLLATKTGEDLQRLRRKVAFDRFLARVFAQEKPEFYLKGGYAMELRVKAARATKDIDLTCIRRVRDPGHLLSHIILNDLQSFARIDRLRQIHLLHLHIHHFHTPRGRVGVENALQTHVDLFAVGEQLIQLRLAEY